MRNPCDGRSNAASGNVRSTSRCWAAAFPTKSGRVPSVCRPSSPPTATPTNATMPPTRTWSWNATSPGYGPRHPFLRSLRRFERESRCEDIVRQADAGQFGEEAEFARVQHEPDVLSFPPGLIGRNARLQQPAAVGEADVGI